MLPIWDIGSLSIVSEGSRTSQPWSFLCCVGSHGIVLGGE